MCLQAKHATEGCMSWGVNGENGDIVDMTDYGVWEAYSVKAQTYKTAIEVRQSSLLHPSNGTIEQWHHGLSNWSTKWQISDRGGNGCWKFIFCF